ncbi:MAG: hypothetical protein HQL24_06765 [Candidatus Omnitrophica bacterium]|nr:hypothetical protein [Candidatus Omnitrophota bacterium]
MSREDIYDHLAQVYLGKRKKTEEKKKKQFSAWFVINIFTAVIIFASVFYGLTAFLTRNGLTLKKNIIFTVYSGPLKIDYNFKQSFTPSKTFSLSIPPTLNPGKYASFQFSIRGKDVSPGIVKVVFKNKRNEIASYYVQQIGQKWQKVNIPLGKFYQITDWSTIVDVSFVLESWNVDSKEGAVLIDEICFAGIKNPA